MEETVENEEIQEEVQEEGIIVDPDEIGGTEEEVEPEGKPEGEPTTEKPTFSEGFMKKYEGKGSDELLKIIRNQEEFIGKQTNEIGDLRKRTTEKKLTSKEMKDKIASDKSKLVNYRDKLENLDSELDEAEFKATKKRIRQLEQELDGAERNYQETFLKELVYQETAQGNNQKLSGEMRGHYKDEFGLELSDEEWDAAEKTAKETAPDVKLTKEDYEGALVRALGVDKYRKMVMLQGGVNEREKIKVATSKEDKDIGGASKSKGINLLDLSPKSLADAIAKNPKILEKLTPKQLDKLYEKMK